MSKRIESRFSVISADTAVFEASERQIRRCDMDYYVVYTTSAETEFGSKFVYSFFIFREDI